MLDRYCVTNLDGVENSHRAVDCNELQRIRLTYAHFRCERWDIGIPRDYSRWEASVIVILRLS